VYGAPAHTSFYVQRAAEIGRANAADGVCQRAAGLPPWGPACPRFRHVPESGVGATRRSRDIVRRFWLGARGLRRPHHHRRNTVRRDVSAG
jgi:hypothetical protein